jgi:hypothetical protein
VQLTAIIFVGVIPAVVVCLLSLVPLFSLSEPSAFLFMLAACAFTGTTGIVWSLARPTGRTAAVVLMLLSVGILASLFPILAFIGMLFGGASALRLPSTSAPAVQALAIAWLFFGPFVVGCLQFWRVANAKTTVA